MASQVAYDQLKSHLLANFAPALPTLDYDDIEPAIGQGSDPFLAIEEMSASEDLVAFGDPTNLCMRETGAFAVHAFTPSPESSGAARALIDTVRQSLRLASLGQVRIKAVSPPDYAFANEGLWSAASTIVVYEVDFHAARP